jgi:hypothetical protein
MNWMRRAGDGTRGLVFDPAGRLIRVVRDGPGASEARWNLDRDDGRPVAAGIYVVCVEAGGEMRARRVAVTR